MGKQEKCIHNDAIYPGKGVVCGLRKPNSLCENCPSYKRRYPSYCCQRCGEPIGYIGRFVEWIYCGIITHDCIK